MSHSACWFRPKIVILTEYDVVILGSVSMMYFPGFSVSVSAGNLNLAADELDVRKIIETIRVNTQMHNPETPYIPEDQIDYQAGAIVSKVLLKNPSGTVTLFAFAKEESLSEHTAPFDVLVQVLDGAANITIDGRLDVVSAGQMIRMPANIPHAVHAEQPFKMLLIMIRAGQKSD